MSKVPALLKWIGNKQRFAETIISYMPEQFNNYYEPFLGSGAVMAQLLYQNSTTSTPMFTHSYASDILPFLIDIFNIINSLWVFIYWPCYPQTNNVCCYDSRLHKGGLSFF